MNTRKSISQFSTAVGHMSHNGRQLCAVADWMRRNPNNHKRSKVAMELGFPFQPPLRKADCYPKCGRFECFL